MNGRIRLLRLMYTLIGLAAFGAVVTIDKGSGRSVARGLFSSGVW